MKKYKQVPLTIYPEAESMLEEAMKLTGNLQASVLREALTMGLKQILSQHQPARMPSIDDIISDLEDNTDLDFFTPGNYDMTPSVRRVLEKHLGHQPPQDPQSLQEMQEKINQIWDKVIGEG